MSDAPFSAGRAQFPYFKRLGTAAGTNGARMFFDATTNLVYKGNSNMFSVVTSGVTEAGCTSIASPASSYRKSAGSAINGTRCLKFLHVDPLENCAVHGETSGALFSTTAYMLDVWSSTGCIGSPTSGSPFRVEFVIKFRRPENKWMMWAGGSGVGGGNQPTAMIFRGESDRLEFPLSMPNLLTTCGTPGPLKSLGWGSYWVDELLGVAGGGLRNPEIVIMGCGGTSTVGISQCECP